MTATPTQSIDTLQADVATAHDIIHGPATGVGSSVSTDSGLVPTFAAKLATLPNSMPSVDTIAALTALAKAGLTDNQTMSVAGYWTATGRGGGIYVWQAASADVVELGYCYAANEGGVGRWKRSGVVTDVYQAGAKGDGVADDTSAALVMGAGAHFPDGTFSLTQLPAESWGSGKVVVGGVRVPIPEWRWRRDIINTIQSKLADTVRDYGFWCDLGDSIAHGLYLAGPHERDINLLQQAFHRDAGCSGSEVTETYFGDNFYGGVAKTSAGVAIDLGIAGRWKAVGPLGSALQLTAGDYIEIAGDIDQLDAYYQGGITYSGGHLLIKCIDTAATLKDIDTSLYDRQCYSGVNPADDSDNPTMTGTGGTSKTYRLEAAGGNVTITGITRRKISTRQVPHFMLNAWPGVSTGHFVANGTIAAMLEQMNYCKITKKYAGVVRIRLGTNDRDNPAVGVYQTPSQYQSNLISIARQIQLDGKTVLIQPPYRTSVAVAIPGETFGNYDDAARRAAEECLAQIVPLNEYDFLGQGLLVDGTHYNVDGADKALLLSAEWCATEMNVSRLQRKIFTPRLCFGGVDTGNAYSTQEGEIVRLPGGVCILRLRIILSIMGSGVGAATIEDIPLSAFFAPQIFNVETSTGITLSNATLGSDMNGGTSINLVKRAITGPKSNVDNTNFPAVGACVADIYLNGVFFDATASV